LCQRKKYRVDVETPRGAGPSGGDSGLEQPFILFFPGFYTSTKPFSIQITIEMTTTASTGSSELASVAERTISDTPSTEASSLTPQTTEKPETEVIPVTQEPTTDADQEPSTLTNDSSTLSAEDREVTTA
jgi:hypothetical protein